MLLRIKESIFFLVFSTYVYCNVVERAGNLKEGEVCGLCTDPERDFNCGRCAPGLECFDETPNDIDDPMICKLKTGNQQIGEVCGLCTDPDKNFFCGHCEAGLECFDSTPNEKDDPMICREIRDDSCDNKQCGQACNWELDVAGRCDQKGKCTLDYTKLECDSNARTKMNKTKKLNDESTEKGKIIKLKPLNLKPLKQKNITQNDNTTELNLLELEGIGSGIFIKMNHTNLKTLVSKISDAKQENGTESDTNLGDRDDKNISLRRSRHSNIRHLRFSDYYSGFKIDEDNEIPDGEDPVEDAMEKGNDFQGDIALNAKEEEIIINGTKNDSISMRAALREGHWKGNPRDDNVYIPFTISRDFKRSEVKNIARAIEDYKNKTCIRIVERHTLPKAERGDFVAIVKGQGCNSKLGRRGGRQEISLGHRCADNVGTPVHEFLHALGFWHEQMRKDRDDYITINWDNISPGTELQFKKCDACGDQGLKYDIGSVMHYHATAFALNRSEPTIIPKNGFIGSIGQRNGMSDLDIKGVNMMYCPDHESIANASPCEDKLPRCRRWVTFCDHKKYPNRKNFMVSFCAGTCRVCEGGCIQKDLHEFCEAWAADYCNHHTWKGWMKINCGKSCEVCNG